MGKLENVKCDADDYKSAITHLYKDRISEKEQLQNRCNDCIKLMSVYSANRYSAGNPIQKNIEMYDSLMTERKQLAIMIEILKQEAKKLEEIYVMQGFSLDELQESVKTKRLLDKN